MKTHMEVETPFDFCPSCSHISPKEMDIYGSWDWAKYQCEYYNICEDAVNMYKKANKEKERMRNEGLHQH